MAPNITNAQRAEILTQALPYIQKYNGKIVVVKYGGNAMTSEDLKQQVMEDIVLLYLIGVKFVLVHGGKRLRPGCRCARSEKSAKNPNLSTVCG